MTFSLFLISLILLTLILEYLSFSVNANTCKKKNFRSSIVLKAFSKHRFVAEIFDCKKRDALEKGVKIYACTSLFQEPLHRRHIWQYHRHISYGNLIEKNN